jgi:hypothetical protein
LIFVPTLPFLTDFFKKPVLLGAFFPWIPASFIHVLDLVLEILWAVCMSALVLGSLLFPRYETKILALCITLLCLCDLAQYHLFFVQYHIYEPVPKELMRAVKIYVN